MKYQSVGFKGATNGVSLRVAKGVTIRTGGVRGHTVKGLVPIANGEFALLNNRAVFAGDMKSFDIPYDKITHAENAQNGIIIHVGGISYPVTLDDEQTTYAMQAILHRLLDQSSQIDG